MSYSSRMPTLRHRSAQILLLALLMNCVVPATFSYERPASKAKIRAARTAASKPLLTTQPAVETFVRVINIPTNDLVFNTQTLKIHATVPSSAGSNGNSITDIDPFAGTVGQSVFVGSEPNKIALSADGQVLYASLDGSASIRKVDVATHIAGQQFFLGPDQSTGSAMNAFDVAVAPGNSNLVAVSRRKVNAVPQGGGVVVFDNGVQRPTVSGNDSNFSIAFSTSDTTLYGSNPFAGLQTFTVGASGVTLSNTSQFVVGNDIQFENGIIYSSNGRVVNPTSNTQVGVFANVGTSPFVVDPIAGRAYFVIDNSFNQNQTVILRAFDTNTFVPVGETTIAGVTGTASSVVRWGANGLAFRTSSNQLFLIQTSLIPSVTPVPLPTPTPSPTPTPTPVPFDVDFRPVQLRVNDLTYNPSDQNIYCSVPSSGGSVGNSVTPINPSTGSIGTSVFVGSEPNRLALSEDGQSLYVGLDGAGSIRRFDVGTHTAGPQFLLTGGDNHAPYTASDLAVMPGSSTTLAVARGVGFDASIAIFDNGTKRTNTSNGFGNDIEFGASSSRLYSFGAIGGEFIRNVVNASGVSFESSLPAGGNGGKILFANGLIYTANGSVFDPETGNPKGLFTGNNLSSNSIMTVDVALGRAYFLSTVAATVLLRVYDINTFLPIGQATLPNTGSISNSSLVRWGDNGLAFRMGTRVALIQSTLINPGVPAPAPTPTPSPTPVPSPTPPATTFSRQVDLPVNDVIYQPGSPTINASIPSFAGTRGNSITPITLASGALGTSVPIGSEPNRLALSDDGQVLYAGLDGPGAIRRFDIVTQTAGLQFSLGTDSSFGIPFKANDIAVLPGSHDSLAVARHTSASPPQGGVAIYDNDVKRPTTTPGHIVASSFLAFSQNPSILYGGGFDSGLNTMTLNASGVTVTNSTPYIVGPYIEFKNGLVYSTRGQVVNPANGALVGTFSNIPTSAFTMTVDVALGKIFFASQSSNNVIISAYDINTFLPIGQISLPFNGVPTRLVRWGVNGLAVCINVSSTDKRLYLVQSALVSTAGTIPTGIQFNSTSFLANESAGRVDVPVNRTGDLSGSSSINYSTSDGTASERSDYSTAIGRIEFGPGESTKTIPVFITNDVLQENPETFTVTLSGAVGGDLVSPTTTTVTIQDNDFFPPSSNPIDTTTFFVRQHYRDFLNRDPDSAGLSFWSNQINQCGSDLQCVEIKRINVSAAFFLSIEFQETGYLAYRMYKVSYGDTTSPNVTTPVPIIRFREFLTDAQRLGRGVQVGIGNWEQQLETNKTEYAREFVVTPRFVAEFPLTMTPAQFVGKLDQNAGGVLSTLERDQLIAELTGAPNPTQARASVARKVAEDSDLRNRESNRAFVLMQYYGYLRRNPDDPQDTDFRGWEFWLNKLNQFNGNFIDAEMVKSFLVSGEYRQRFGP